MFRAVNALRFERKAGNGRNGACFITCLDESSTRVEAVVKFAGLSESGSGTLVREALTAFFACDLGLPIPEPLLVEASEPFLASLLDNELRSRISKGSRYAFGSAKLPGGFQVYAPALPLAPSLLQTAGEVFVFDTFVANYDRAPHNPNCLVDGSSVCIIDHDLAFMISGLLFWKEPWVLGGGDTLSRDDKHIFWSLVQQKRLSFERMHQALIAITDERLEHYISALPTDWISGNSVATETIDYIKRLKTNADKAFAEIQRVMQ